MRDTPGGADRGNGAGKRLPWKKAAPAAEESRAGFGDEALPHMEAVYRFALRLSGGKRDHAEDLMQDTFLQAFRAWHTYAPGSNCLAWLITICRNTFLRGRERGQRSPEVSESEVEADIGAVAAAAVFSEAAAADPERAFFDSFVDEGVTHAVDALPEPYREVVVLSALEGLHYDELSRVLDVPLGTVKSRLYRARRLLQQSLYDYARQMGYVRPTGRE